MSPALFATSNNITSVTVGGSANTVSLTFDSNGVITGASNNALSVANTQITGNITSSQIAPDQTFYGAVSVTGNTILGDAATDTLNVGAGGLVKDASGNVGIGTSSPEAILHTSISGSGEVGRFATTTNSTPFISIYSDGSIRAKLRASTAETALLSQGALPLVLGTNDTERARIDSSGGFIVGTTTFASGQNGVLLRGTNSGATDEVLQSRTSGTGSKFNTAFYNDNGRVGSINTSGSSTSYNTSSDYRLKNTIAPMTGALDKVALLKPVTYKWKIDGSDGQGFIAHELQVVVPDCVSGEKDAVNEDGTIKPQGIDTSFLVATLTAAIQELKAIVDAQAVRIAALEIK